jgi:predicted component of type VI protein secretion system
MKKLIPLILFAAIVMGCNNSADNVQTKDSVNVDVNTHDETNKDTSSYDRMPNKTNDSMQQ